MTTDFSGMDVPTMYAMIQPAQPATLTSLAQEWRKVSTTAQQAGTGVDSALNTLRSQWTSSVASGAFNANVGPLATNLYEAQAAAQDTATQLESLAGTLADVQQEVGNLYQQYIQIQATALSVTASPTGISGQLTALNQQAAAAMQNLADAYGSVALPATPQYIGPRGGGAPPADNSAQPTVSTGQTGTGTPGTSATNGGTAPSTLASGGTPQPGDTGGAGGSGPDGGGLNATTTPSSVGTLPTGTLPTGTLPGGDLSTSLPGGGTGTGLTAPPLTPPPPVTGLPLPPADGGLPPGGITLPSGADLPPLTGAGVDLPEFAGVPGIGGAGGGQFSDGGGLLGEAGAALPGQSLPGQAGAAPVELPGGPGPAESGGGYAGMPFFPGAFPGGFGGASTAGKYRRPGVGGLFDDDDAEADESPELGRGGLIEPEDFGPPAMRAAAPGHRPGTDRRSGADRKPSTYHPWDPSVTVVSAPAAGEPRRG